MVLDFAWVIFAVIMQLILVFFPLFAYRDGFREGLKFQGGKVPETVADRLAKKINEVKDDKVQKKHNAEIDKILEGYQNIMSYDGQTQPKVRD